MSAPDEFVTPRRTIPIFPILAAVLAVVGMSYFAIDWRARERECVAACTDVPWRIEGHWCECWSGHEWAPRKGATDAER